MAISPRFTLREIYGPEFLFNPRTSYTGLGWIPTDPVFDDFRTGVNLAIAGDMPLICNERVVTEDILELFKLAGMSPAPNLEIYHSEEELRSLLDDFGSSQQKQVVNQIYPPGEIPVEGYWIKPNLLTMLNNKANLEMLVPAENLPNRMLIWPNEMDRVKEEWALPFVMKAATELPNGGGIDVFLCRTWEDVAEAQELLKDSEQIVVEEMVEIEENFCVQFAKTHVGNVEFLGTTDQIISEEGNHKGNWVNGQTPPDKVIELGRTIMEKACMLGYIGVAGFDILVTKDGRAVCIDLNFRMNGSTPALLLKDSIIKNSGKEYLLFRTWKAETSWKHFYSTCSALIKEKSLFPLSIYHPENYGKVLISAILAGDSKEEILELEDSLRGQGWA